MWPTCCWPPGPGPPISDLKRFRKKKTKRRQIWRKVGWRSHGKGMWARGTRSNTPIFVHIRTSRDAWTGCALLCNSGAKSWQMRRDGLEPAQPHHPKISRPYSRGSMCWVDVLLKIPRLKIVRKVNWFSLVFEWALSPFQNGVLKVQRYLAPPPERTPQPAAAGMNRWLFWGSLWRLPRGSSIQRGSWNIRSRITRFWSSSLASRCWLCHSYGSGPPGHTAGSLKNRLTEWF